jgi:YcxB-like protein
MAPQTSSSSHEPISLSFQLRIEDWWDSWKLRNEIGPTGVVLFALPFVVLVYIGCLFPQLIPRSLILVVPVFGTGLFLVVVRKLAFRAACQEGTKQQKESLISMTISEDGIQGMSAKEPWSSMTAYGESAHSFVLYKGNAIHAIIPKRSITTEAEAARLRELLQSKLSADAGFRKNCAPARARSH